MNHDASTNPSKDQYSILSIDMGIRNLAYCRLSQPPAARRSEPRPVISEWARIEVSKKAPKSMSTEEAKVREAFDPATYSQHAYDLVTNLVSSTPRPPSQILIERQRFRSMGGSAVQEWTLRVNMFEAMIYAVLKTFAESGKWHGSVHPVAPAKVSKCWLGDKEGADAEDLGIGSKSARTKTAKINLVSRWLGDSDRFVLEGKAKDLGQSYVEKKMRGVRRRAMAEHTTIKDGVEIATRTTSEIGKLDDLADCLLQGMAWIKWEQNRKLIISKGQDALDNLD